MAGSDLSSSQFPLPPTEVLLAASVARRFYLDNQSKVQISKEFDISRFKVARLLETAVAHGIVEINITVPADIDIELSTAMRRRFGLKHAIVVEATADDPEGPEPVTDWLAPTAAQLIANMVEPDDVLGLAWGCAVGSVAQAFTKLPPCTVVQLTGVHPLEAITADSVEAVHRAAAVSGGKGYPIYAPLVLPNKLTADILRCQPGIAESLAQFDRVTKAVMAIGAWRSTLSTVFDSLTVDEREQYRSLGVVAEMGALLFDKDGRTISTELNDRVISVGSAQLSRIPEVIGVAGGIQKAEAIGAVLRSGLLTSIVTDSSAALHILGGSLCGEPPRERDLGPRLRTDTAEVAQDTSHIGLAEPASDEAAGRRRMNELLPGARVTRGTQHHHLAGHHPARWSPGDLRQRGSRPKAAPPTTRSGRRVDDLQALGEAIAARTMGSEESPPYTRKERDVPGA
ncbi:sugar-binding transcriptional regulator [Streptomyces sp. NPDC019531]|uniref:sugar-binding transcriptional regulator n=1 Tax=Streptomyces sp. NPDC019531 TaxID=3365062 RepID=UPI00384D9A53